MAGITNMFRMEIILDRDCDLIDYVFTNWSILHHLLPVFNIYTKHLKGFFYDTLKTFIRIISRTFTTL